EPRGLGFSYRLRTSASAGRSVGLRPLLDCPSAALYPGERRGAANLDEFLPDDPGEQRVFVCRMSAHMEPFSLTRRAFLARYAGSLGGLALAHLLASDRARADGLLAPQKPHHRPRAQAVICLFQHGGPSQVDLFDPKPELSKRHGQPYPGELEAHFHTQVGKLLASPFAFRRAGQAGMELSELLPH